MPKRIKRLQGVGEAAAESDRDRATGQGRAGQGRVQFDQVAGISNGKWQLATGQEATSDPQTGIGDDDIVAGSSSNSHVTRGRAGVGVGGGVGGGGARFQRNSICGSHI